MTNKVIVNLKHKLAQVTQRFAQDVNPPPVLSWEAFCENVTRGWCMRCGRELTPVVKPRPGEFPEITHQFNNSMHLVWSTGYGMFSDLVFDPDWQANNGNVDFDLCHDCAVDFLAIFMRIDRKLGDFANGHDCAVTGDELCRFGYEMEDGVLHSGHDGAIRTYSGDIQSNDEGEPSTSPNQGSTLHVVDEGKLEG